jgi:hypothetical protein
MIGPLLECGHFCHQGDQCDPLDEREEAFLLWLGEHCLRDDLRAPFSAHSTHRADQEPFMRDAPNRRQDGNAWLMLDKKGVITWAYDHKGKGNATMRYRLTARGEQLLRALRPEPPEQLTIEEGVG